MEDKFPGRSREENPDDASVAGSSHERAGSGYLRRGVSGDALFRRLFESSDSESDDDEEEDEGVDSVEKKRQGVRRFRRSFRNIFRRQIVSEPNYVTDNHEGQDTNQPSTESVVPLRNFGDWLRRMSTSLEADDDRHREEGNASMQHESIERPEPRVNVADLLSSISGDVTSPGEMDEHSDSENHTTSENEPTTARDIEEVTPRTENSGNSSATDNIEPLAPIDPTESIQQIIQRQSSGIEDAGYGGPSTGIISETSLPSGDTTVIHNETYNTLNGWGPALVVDQLSRRRDRKIRRHDNAQDKRITQLEQGRSNDQWEATNNLQHLQSKIEKIQQTVVNPNHNNETRLPQGTQNERLAAPVVLPEKFVSRSIDTSDQPPRQQVEMTNNVEKITTAEVIQKTVEKAAEAAVPIESLYERRHEIKGNDDFAASAEAAIKTITDKPTEDILSGENDVDGSVASMLKKEQKSNKSVQNDLYGQAAKGGALLAVLIIIAFLVVYMLNR